MHKEMQILEQIAKAWESDPTFRSIFRKSPKAALARIGLDEKRLDAIIASKLSNMSDEEISIELSNRNNKGYFFL